MKTGTTIAVAAAAVAVIAVGAYMIDFDVTEEGRLPDVDVSVDEGKLPEVDMQVGSIETGTTTKTVTVPEVEVDTREAEIKLPTVSVNPPSDG